ncbi:MAG: hypothetical protein JWM16_2233 [Verrucomicrobiales bacterium]|jgi:hypothetical protein|nr:hypothetical protein [Verrucomicrobiales bacterium]
MSRNLIALLLVLVLLGTGYAWMNDWFRKPPIQIIAQVRPNRVSAIPRADEGVAVYPVSFALDGKYNLTSVKVLSVDDVKTNKYPEALWHLISDSNSIPTKSFLYGQKIPGMKPSVPRGHPQPLQPNTPYMLVIEAGKLQGKTNFFTKEVL